VIGEQHQPDESPCFTNASFTGIAGGGDGDAGVESRSGASRRAAISKTLNATTPPRAPRKGKAAAEYNRSYSTVIAGNAQHAEANLRPRWWD